MAATDDERAEAADRFADRRIFVSVVAYADADVVATVRHALAAAARPSRLRFGICHLHDDTSNDADPFGDDPRIALDRVSIRDGGPIGWARARTQVHFDAEPYVLQVDPPVRFAQGWDRRMIELLESTGRARPMITDRRTPGLLFAPGRFVVDVPSDPWITADVEELTVAIRAYTHGYDVVPLDEELVVGTDRDPVLRSVDPDEGLAARVRVDGLIGGDHRSMGRHGLGSLRTIAAYECLTGRRVADVVASGVAERQ